MIDLMPSVFSLTDTGLKVIVDESVTLEGPASYYFVGSIKNTSVQTSKFMLDLEFVSPPVDDETEDSVSLEAETGTFNASRLFVFAANSSKPKPIRSDSAILWKYKVPPFSGSDDQELSIKLLVEEGGLNIFLFNKANS